MSNTIAFNPAPNTTEIQNAVVPTSGRNDLVAIVANGTTLPLTVNTVQVHGNFIASIGNNPIPAVTIPPGATSVAPNVWAMGIAAAGAGSNLYLYITSGPNVWGVILCTVPNGSNYLQYVYYGWLKTQADTYNAAVGSQKYVVSGESGGIYPQFYAQNGSTVAKYASGRLPKRLLRGDRATTVPRDFMKTTISGKFRVRLEEVAEEEEPLLDRVLNLVEAVGMFRLVLDGTRGVEEGADGRQRVVQLVVGCS